MALINLYTASGATVLGSGDTLNVNSASYFSRRHDAAYFNSNGMSAYRLYRDGTAVRVRHAMSYYYSKTYDVDLDLGVTFQVAGVNLNDDPISYTYDPSKPSRLTHTGVLAYSPTSGVIWKNAWYRTSGSTVYKKSLDASADLGSFAVAGTLSFTADRVYITPDGTVVLLDFDNGTYGVARFYDLSTGLSLYESTFARSAHAFVDMNTRNIWSIGLSDNIMRTYSFSPAPTVFDPLTVGSNRSRYREDAISATLKGSNGELITNWPVGWTLTGAGSLRDAASITDANGVATNVYRGPQDAGSVGTSVTIEAWTGY